MKQKFFNAIKVMIIALVVTTSSLGDVSFLPNVVVTEAATVKISEKKLSLEVGKSKTLKVIGTKQKVQWSTSNKNVAAVTSKGKVTAKKVGTAKITAKVAKKKFTCTVTVKKKSVPTEKELTANKIKLQNFIIANGESFSNDGMTVFYRYVYPISESEAVYLQYSDDLGLQMFYHQILGNKENSDTIIRIDTGEITYSYSNFWHGTILYNAKTSININTYNLTDRLVFSYSGVTEDETKMYLKASSSVPTAFKRISPVLNDTVKLGFVDLGFFCITDDALK